MSIVEMIKQAKVEGVAQFFSVYANVGNDTNELVVCTAEEADKANAQVKDIHYIEHHGSMRTMVITAEVK